MSAKQTSIPTAVRLAVVERDSNCCTRCSSTIRLHVHHILPRCEGGDNSLENLTLVCHACHTAIHEERGDVGAAQLLRGQKVRRVGPLKTKKPWREHVKKVQYRMRMTDVSEWRKVYSLTSEESLLLTVILAMTDEGTPFVRDIHGEGSANLRDVHKVMRSDAAWVKDALDSLWGKRVVMLFSPNGTVGAEIANRVILLGNTSPLKVELLAWGA